MTDAVHKHEGAKIAMQILHAGRYGYHPFNVGPTKAKAPIGWFTPKALSATAVEQTIDDFVRCAALAEGHSARRLQRAWRWSRRVRLQAADCVVLPAHLLEERLGSEVRRSGLRLSSSDGASMLRRRHGGLAPRSTPSTRPRWRLLRLRLRLLLAVHLKPPLQRYELLLQSRPRMLHEIGQCLPDAVARAIWALL